MQPRYRDLSLNLWILVVGVFAMRVGQFMVLPFLSIILTQQFHSSPVTVGIIVGAGPLAFALSSVNCGQLTDRFGAKKILLLSLLFAAVSMIGMYYLRSLFAYFILNLALGAFRSAFNAASRAYIYLTVLPQQRMLAYGVNYIAINVGLGVGLLVGALFAAHHSDAIFIYVAIIYFLLLISLWFILFDKQAEKGQQMATVTLASTFKTIFTDHKLLFLVVGGVIVGLAFVQYDSILPIYLVNTLSNGTSIYVEVILVNAVLIFALQPFISKIMYQVAFMRQVVIVAIFFIIGYFLFLFFNTTVWYMLGMAFSTLGEIILFPLIDVWIGSLATAERSGAYYAAGNFIMLGNAVGAGIGGRIYESFGIKAVFLFCIICSIIMLPLFKKALPR